VNGERCELRPRFFTFEMPHMPYYAFAIILYELLPTKPVFELNTDTGLHIIETQWALRFYLNTTAFESREMTQLK
jgi:hypothetical protein